MNIQSNPSKEAPDFDKMVWKCPCCGQDRTDKYIKIFTHDIGKLHGLEPGVMFVNVKYCADMQGCKEKAFDRAWVISHFFPKQAQAIS